MKTGTWTDTKASPSPRRASGRGRGGFTLIEIVLVVLILSLVSAIVLPRLGAFTGEDLRRTTRRLAATFRSLHQEASARKTRYRLRYDLREGTYWVEVHNPSGEFVQDGGKRFLPRGVSFEDVVTLQQGKISSGESFTEFFPLGVENTTLHLRDQGGRVFTLSVNPLTGRMKVIEGYVEVDER